MMLILGFFTFLLVNEETRLVPKDTIKELKTTGAAMFIAGAVFFISFVHGFLTYYPFGKSNLPLAYYQRFIPF